MYRCNCYKKNLDGYLSSEVYNKCSIIKIMKTIMATLDK